MKIKEEIHSFVTINKYLPKIADSLERIANAITVLALTKELEERKENDEED
jgi:predicted house-cleaning noncanonical NTP pyrophosphatase (MazG superfamily)